MTRSARILATLVAFSGCAERPADTRDAPQPPETAADRSPDYVNPDLATAAADGVAIVARDPVTGDFGAIAATRSPACGAFVVDARAGVGAAAALGQVGGAWRDDLLVRLAAGAEGAVHGFVDCASDRARRRAVVAVDAAGGHATHLGVASSTSSAGGPDFAVLACGVTDLDLDALRAHWPETASLPFAERLVEILQHACGASPDLAGARAARSAALLVVREHGGPFGRSDRLVDVRVDWHAEPLAELERALTIQLRAYTAPRLTAMQRGLDRDSALYTANAAWLERIRSGMLTGDQR